MQARHLDVPRRSGGSLSALIYEAVRGRRATTLILAHGAGAPQAHPFMVEAARALAARGVTVVTFNFPYMDAGRRLPDRTPVLEVAWLDAIAAVAARIEPAPHVFIGGKSMGGRIASHIAALDETDPRGPAARLAGLLCLGYPLHPPGRPEQRRDAHLAGIRCPVLVVQGARDAFGTPEELRPVLAPLGSRAALHVVAGGDHSFAVPRTAGRRKAEVLDEVWDVVAAWIARV